MNEDGLRRSVALSLDTKRRFFEENAGTVVAAGERIAASLRAGGRLYTFGNGGSAADAQHFASELVGRFQKPRPALSALALTTDASAVTAISNDFGFERVFARQLEAHGRPGDVAFGITTSGRSPNVLAALRLAREMRLVAIGLTGKGGGEVKGLADILIDVSSDDTQRIQETHAMIVHALCEIIEDAVTA
jgi:D-sedoheptulose 7-phosphate isomerase